MCLVGNGSLVWSLVMIWNDAVNNQKNKSEIGMGSNNYGNPSKGMPSQPRFESAQCIWLSSFTYLRSDMLGGATIINDQMNGADKLALNTTLMTHNINCIWGGLFIIHADTILGDC